MTYCVPILIRSNFYMLDDVPFNVLFYIVFAKRTELKLEA